MIDFDDEETSNIKSVTIQKSSAVHLTMRFMKGKMLTYGPNLPILSGVSQITHSSPNVLNQEKFSRIFNIINLFFSSKN